MGVHNWYCVLDPSGRSLDLALVAYTFTKGPEHEILVRPHGNSRSGSEPYQRTLPSTLTLLKESGNRPAKAIVSSIASEQGGLLGIRSAGELPRNQKQVYNTRLKKVAQCDQQDICASAKEKADVLYYLMEQSRKCHGDTPFVRDVKAVPEPMCVLATDIQLDDLVRFCTDPNQFAVLCIDPTFCIGEFNVTPIVYQHPLLESRRYGASPIVHGPILVHQKKEFSSYNYFLSTLVGLRPQLSAVQAFGSDGEESLVQALKSNFPWAQQLRCFLHMRRNLKSKLNEYHVTSTSSSIIMADIFGKNDGTNFHEGLVDAPNEKAFFTQLENMKKKWNELEQGDSKQQPKFFNWFVKYEGQVFADTMIKPMREAACLGSPPSEFTTNVCESGHAALKNYLPKRNQCSWQEFVQKSLQFVNDQQREVEMAILNRGQYRFKKQYSFLVAEERWFRLNKDQQKAHLRKVHMQKPCYDLGPPESGHSSAVASTSGTEPCELTKPIEKSSASSSASKLGITSAEFASQVKISHDTIQAVWRKAEILLKTEGSIVSSPGMEKSWFVESKSKQAPHLVRVSPKGSISCDKACEHYRSIGICSHTVAIAQKVGSLKEFAKSFIKKKGAHLPNLGNFALTGMPPGRSRKGAVPPRRRVPKSGSSMLPHTPLPFNSHEENSNSGVSLLQDLDQTSELTSFEGNNNLLDQSIEDPPLSRNHTSNSSVRASSTSGATGMSPPQSAPLYNFFGSCSPYHQASSSFNQPSTSFVQPSYNPTFYQPNYGTSSYQQSWTPAFPLPLAPLQTNVCRNEHPFVLKFLNHMLKVCAGCRAGYYKKADGSLPDPPYDICVSHETFITLTHPVNKTPLNKQTKSHFHANPHCIFLKHSSFSPTSLIVPQELLPRLTWKHWEYLGIHFGIYPPEQERKI